MGRTSRLPKVLLICAAVPLVLLAAWPRVIEPTLVKIPGGIDRTNHYTGTVTVFLDAASGSTLATPQTSPMSITRVTQSVPGETGATTTALRDTDTIDLLGHHSDQTSVFVLDRSSARNVNDDRAVAFGDNPVNRHSAYYPNLPFNVDNKRTYPIWNNEAAHVYVVARADGSASTTVNGVKVLRMRGVLEPTPIASYFLPELQKLGSPTELTPAQLQAQIEASGVKASDVLDGLAKVIPADEMGTIIGILSSPLPLQYSTALTADALVEPTTGIVVRTRSVKQFFVQPAAYALRPVQQILDSHSDDAFVKAVNDNLKALAGTPRPAFTLDYTTDPASVSSMADYASTQRDKLKLATLWAPAALLLLTVVLALASFWTWRRSRPQPPAVPPRGPTPEPEKEHELAGV